MSKRQAQHHFGDCNEVLKCEHILRIAADWMTPCKWDENICYQLHIPYEAGSLSYLESDTDQWFIKTQCTCY